MVKYEMNTRRIIVPHIVKYNLSTLFRSEIEYPKNTAPYLASKSEIYKENHEVYHIRSKETTVNHCGRGRPP